MLVNTASEGESDESVVSEKSEKRVERGESGGVGGGELLDWHRISTSIKSPPRKTLEKLKKNFKNFYEEFYKKFIRPLRKFNKESSNLIRFSHIDFYKLPI